MILELLLLNTVHFALNVFSAFAFFAAGVLYFDAWKVNTKIKTPLLRGSGFFLLSIVSGFEASALASPHIILFTQSLLILGLILIFWSLVSEPILHPPKDKSFLLLFPVSLTTLSFSLMPLSAMLMLLVAFTYFRKASEGKDKQLMPTSLAFLFLALAQTLKISFFWADSPVVFFSKLLSPFGPIDNISGILQFLGVAILGTWIWGYIRFRLQLQLFVSVVALSLIIFLITTFFYSFLLLRSMQNDAFSHLKTDINVLQYSLDSLKQKTLAQAQAIAQDSSIREALSKNDKEALYNITTDYLMAQKTSTLLIASASGQVLMRAEDRERVNDNVSSDPAVKRALTGEEVATVSYSEGVVAPEVTILSAVPIRQGSRSQGRITGVVLTGFVIDSAFVDGVKQITGLDTTVFGKDKRSATTFVSPDGKSRYIGTIDSNQDVLDRVLKNGEIYVGTARVLNAPYYTAYAPLKSFDNQTIGMLFTGKLQNTLTEAASRSLDITFLGSIILMTLSLIPAYFFAKFLNEHLEA